MIWTTNRTGDVHSTPDFHIYRGIRGYSVMACYANDWATIGREIPTLTAAMQLCEEHQQPRPAS